jgi:hypothetical protein
MNLSFKDTMHSKVGFQRERRTDLYIQDFGKVFAAFCLQTYEKREFSFSKIKALEYLDSAKTICGIKYESHKFLVMRFKACAC